MLPISDHNPRRTFPFVTYLLIAANIAAFAWEVSLGREFERVLYTVAFVPSRFWMSGYWTYDVTSTFISMFLHGGLLHIGSNMLYLWIFGDNIEDRLGHGRFAAFYALCGLAATFAHAFSNPTSSVPAIGASGAIAGVLGAYLIRFPTASVTTVIPIFVFVTVREVPAVVILGLWFALQLFSGVGSLGAPMADGAGGIAWFAHIGGFVAGVLLILVMEPRRRASR